MSDESHRPTTIGTALLWFFCCLPIGFMQWGQSAKGWVWLLIAVFTGGLGGLVGFIDYWMCFGVQKQRPLREWEFFPSR
jgi:hypothetical protein